MAKDKPLPAPAQQDGEAFDGASKVKLEKAHDLLDRPEKFAKLFCDVAKNQVTVQTLLKEMIREALRGDTESREALMKLIRQAMKEDWRTWARSAWGKVGLAAWTVVTLAIGAYLDTLLGAA